VKNRTLGFALCLLAHSAVASDVCDNLTLQQRFRLSKVVVLAYVTESTYPPVDSKTFYAEFDAAVRAATANPDAKREIPNLSELFQGTATLAVVKSWKDSVLPGESIKAAPPQHFVSLSDPSLPHPVHVGERVLVFSFEQNPIWLGRCDVLEGADADGAIKALNALANLELGVTGPNQRLERP
jgi:hypothetical protein